MRLASFLVPSVGHDAAIGVEFDNVFQCGSEFSDFAKSEMFAEDELRKIVMDDIDEGQNFDDDNEYFDAENQSEDGEILSEEVDDDEAECADGKCDDNEVDLDTLNDKIRALAEEIEQMPTQRP